MKWMSEEELEVKMWLSMKMNIATFYQHVGQKRYVVLILGHEPHITSNFEHDTVHTKEDI